MTEAEIYKKSIKRQIKMGILPRYFLAKDDNGNQERTPYRNKRGGKLTWRQISTYAFLTKESTDAEATVSTEPQNPTA